MEALGGGSMELVNDQDSQLGWSINLSQKFGMPIPSLSFRPSALFRKILLKPGISLLWQDQGERLIHKIGHHESVLIP